MIGGRYDWWEGHALGGRDTQRVGTKTLTVSEPHPAFPGFGGRYLPQSQRVDTGPYPCLCREGDAIGGNGDPDGA